jgi:hypothetical protein
MPERQGRKHEKVEPPRAIVCFYEDFNRAFFKKNYQKDFFEKIILLQLIFFLVCSSLTFRTNVFNCPVSISISSISPE